MSTKNVGSNNPTGMSEGVSREEFNQLLDRVSTIEDEKEELQEELENEREARKELETLVGALRKKVNNQEKTDQIHESRLDSQNKAIEELEEESSDSNPTSEQEETTPETPLERVKEDPDSSGVRITASVQRALSIAGHFREWSEKVQAGRVIKGGLKKLVSTAMDEKLSWKQIYRAARKLEELSNGALAFKKNSRHGWMIVLEKPDLLSRVVSGR